jgi:hypothetical protein
MIPRLSLQSVKWRFYIVGSRARNELQCEGEDSVAH